MSAENLRTGSVRPENTRDPRERLVRDKYFSLRPKPLERWLWAQGIPASAERVFWLHWHEGMRSGDWCSAVPLRRVAAECCLDVSTVTRAYQLLAKLGCLRRTDPGRDASNPFNQATAITEVRVPRDLLIELDRHPDRAPRRVDNSHAGAADKAIPKEAETPDRVERPLVSDPFAGLSGRDRLKALSQLTRSMSGPERIAYDEAVKLHRGHMSFDADSTLSAEERGQVLQHLGMLARQPVIAERAAPQATPIAARRSLSVFELARLRREIAAAVPQAAETTLREVVWSIEEGGLKRFSTLHASHIALKKIRENAWTRPNRMPPNWVRALSGAAQPGMCSRA